MKLFISLLALLSSIYPGLVGRKQESFYFLQEYSCVSDDLMDLFPLILNFIWYFSMLTVPSTLIFFFSYSRSEAEWPQNCKKRLEQ